MNYDIAIKEMLRLCNREILQRWLGISVSGSAIIEDLPQETTSLRRSDFPLRVTTESGKESRALLQQLLLRRQKIMIESAFFEVLREEIEKEVREKAWEEGIRSGLLDAIAWGLELKFGAEGLKLWPEIRQIEDVETLRAIQSAIRAGETPEDVRAVYRDLPLTTKTQ